jgi:hypothetical protein
MFSGFDLGKPAQITFTYDYHELVTGDLKANANCHISYDPLRIVPQEGTYLHGHPHQPIVAHIRFQENGITESKELISPSGTIDDPHTSLTGQGSMLVQDFLVPDVAEELIIWFSYRDPETGEIYYDTDNNTHFHFRWPYHDVWIRKANVVDNKTSTSSIFELEIGAIPSISQVKVNLSIINSQEPLKEIISLNDTNSIDVGNKIWLLQQPVPKGAIVRFKVYYDLNGRKYKNDNASKYFFAPQPEPIKFPPPPKAAIRL